MPRRGIGRTLVRLGALALAWGLGACSHAPEREVLDLALNAGSADFTSPTFASVRFGTQQGWAFERGGILTGVGDPVNPYAVAERRAVFVPYRGRFGRQWALIDLAPPEGLERQSCRVEYRGRSTRLDLVPGRQQRFVLLQDTKTRVVLECDESISDPASPGFQPALHLHGFHLFRAKDPLLPALRASPVAPLVVDQEGSARRVKHLAPSSLAFALAPAGEARLAFGAQAEGAELRLAVSLEQVGAPPRELWRAVLTPGASAESVSLPLSRHDEPALLTLRVDAVDLSRVGRAVWIAPRITSPAPRASARPTPEEPRSHLRVERVILVVFDAARASSFSPYGYSRETTPNARRLAEEGVLFEQAFTPAVFTRGAIASLWTSRWYDEHHRGRPLSSRLSKEFTTLGMQLAEQGFHTLGIVANGNAGTAFGLNQGFAQFIGLRGQDPPNADTFPRVLRRMLPRLRRLTRGFVFLHLREPHSPYRPPAPYNTLFGPDRPLVDLDAWVGRVRQGQQTPTPQEVEQLRRLYDGNLAYADANFGAMRELLEEAGIWQKSAIILTADHGEALLEQGFLGHNDALYDTCMHIPLIIRVPGGARGHRVKGLVDLLDLAPTVLDLLGVQPTDPGMRGVSLVPALDGRPFAGKPMVFSRTTARHGDYAVRDARWKYILESRTGHESLIALGDDPIELPVKVDERVRKAYYRQILARRALSFVRPDLPRVSVSRLTPELRDQLRKLGYLE